MPNDESSSRLLVTSGEPAGIGPDLIVKLLHSEIALSDLTFIIDPDLLRERASMLGLPVEIPPTCSAGDISVEGPAILPVKLRTPVTPGKLNPENAPYLLEMLDIAVGSCLAGEHKAMVTGPLQKSVINDAGIPFSGHTEYLAKACDDAFPVMLLACPGLRVALATTHLPLREVPNAITEERIERVITTVIHDMQHRFGITHPRIIVCGLNPHAGEAGHLGREEITIIEPVIDRLRHLEATITGPLPADTAFRQDLRQDTDVYIAMYHDQGLPVLKTLGFGEAVNVTLGLPIIRTSVDHGTALSLAGSGKADSASLLAALEMARQLSNSNAGKSITPGADHV